MTLIKYSFKKLSKSKLAMIERANAVLAEYGGMSVTLRQLFYQFVARGWMPNSLKTYKVLGEAVNDGRLAGLISWDSLTDRTRFLRRLPSWASPKDILDSAAASYREDLWADQEHRVEVWIEKDALVGVVEEVCQDQRIGLFSCRGYISQSEMWSAAQRFLWYMQNGQHPVVLHFGDHDPSGLDMTRDIRARLGLFGVEATVERLALNMDQVEQYNPPPNPAKLSDARAFDYVENYGSESWELDALPPPTLVELVTEHVSRFKDDEAWKTALAHETKQKEKLVKLAKQKKFR